MQKNAMESENFLNKLIAIEDLAEKKTKIYARLLMDASLAKDMEKLSLRHEERKETLVELMTGKKCKNKESEE